MSNTIFSRLCLRTRLASKVSTIGSAAYDLSIRWSILISASRTARWPRQKQLARPWTCYVEMHESMTTSSIPDIQPRVDGTRALIAYHERDMATAQAFLESMLEAALRLKDERAMAVARQRMGSVALEPPADFESAERHFFIGRNGLCQDHRGTRRGGAGRRPAPPVLRSSRGAHPIRGCRADGFGRNPRERHEDPARSGGEWSPPQRGGACKLTDRAPYR